MKDFLEKLKKYFKEHKGNVFLWILIFILGIGINILATEASIKFSNTEDSEYSYNEFLQFVEEGKVEDVKINLNETTFLFSLKDDSIVENTTTKENTELTEATPSETIKVENSTGDINVKKAYICSNPKTENFKEFLLLNNINVIEETEDLNKVGVYEIFRLLFTFVLLFYMFKIMMPGMDSNKLVKKVPDITFDDVAGHDETKKELEFIVEFLKNPDKMKDAGARMPKGIILYGPPGTGKTLFARAIAGTAKVPFYSASGSDFVEMYVGLGAKRVRSLFQEAKKNAPCIVFIDEIDAVGGQRGVNSHSEKDQTINALLTELDGFEKNSGVITICATNRVEDLDSALIRPGRFDKHIIVPLPDKDDRRKIIKLYAADKKFSDDVNLEDLVNTTTGFSGADIEALINDAALEAATKERSIINREDIDSAFFKMVMKGHKKENQSSRDKEELKLVAWHEAGHTLVTKLLTDDEVSKVTILASTSGAGGVTFRNPPESGLQSKSYLEESIKIMYGGRAAEEILNNGDRSKITTGASSDITQATRLIKHYLLHFGMDENIGMINLEEFNKDSLTGITEEARKAASELSMKLYNDTVSLLSENKDTLERLANALLEKETLNSEEIDNIINNSIDKEINDDEVSQKA